MLHVRTVKYIDEFKLWIAFDNGEEGEVDLRNSLSGPIFEALKDKALFKKAAFDPELETVVWPNGADLAPEFLHSLLSNKQGKH